MTVYVPIIIGSDKDMSHAKKILFKLNSLGVGGEIRISSAHKATLNTMKILNKYLEDRNVPTIISCAGKSNALSAILDSKSFKPIIACPPLKHETMYDIYSSVSMPSDVCPLLVLKPENAALAAAKICSLSNSSIRENINQLLNQNKLKLIIVDIQHKYNYIDVDLHNVVKYTDFVKTKFNSQSFNFVRLGKVRDIYQNNDSQELLLSASDRLSCYDRVVTTIPHKGDILNKISVWWFNKTRHIAPNHLLDNHGRFMKVRKMKVIPIEFVMRSYLTGSTNTSIWKNYQAGSREYCGHKLKDGMIRNQQLSCNLLTPTTKDEKHDELISRQEILDRGIMTLEQWIICSNYAHSLFEFGKKIAKERGLILVDTKYEFGFDQNGKIHLIDEIHTPDSSRYWIKHSYKERFESGQEPDIIDKDIIRKWVKKNYENPYDESIDIEVSDEMRVETSRKYMQLYEIITGEEFSSN